VKALVLYCEEDTEKLIPKLGSREEDSEKLIKKLGSCEEDSETTGYKNRLSSRG
jgi:hypothetical protein